jgi:hypothetical protein
LIPTKGDGSTAAKAARCILVAGIRLETSALEKAEPGVFLFAAGYCRNFHQGNGFLVDNPRLPYHNGSEELLNWFTES